MSEEQDQTDNGGPKRDRGPSFPFIALDKAVDRTRQLYLKAKRFEVRVADAAADWGYGAKSSGAFQTIAALLAFGLIEDSGSGDARKIKVSEMGLRILEDNRPGVNAALMAEAALKPKLIAEFAELWKDGRPDDAHAISDLKFDHGFTAESAPRFLRIFDDTIRFTKAPGLDKIAEAAGGTRLSERDQRLEEQAHRVNDRRRQEAAAVERKGIALMEGERELTTGLLSKAASFRLIVSGHVGTKELERLIKKLELDKEILADEKSWEEVIEEVEQESSSE